MKFLAITLLIDGQNWQLVISKPVFDCDGNVLDECSKIEQDRE
jgi:hypothetical protein